MACRGSSGIDTPNPAQPNQARNSRRSLHSSPGCDKCGSHPTHATSRTRPRIPVSFAMPIDPQRIEVIDDQTVAMLRQMTPVQRLLRGLEMCDSARIIVAAGIRAQHPEWSNERVQQEVVRRFTREDDGPPARAGYHFACCSTPVELR